jgi:DNA-binding FadR family transcriptional regulator
MTSVPVVPKLHEHLLGELLAAILRGEPAEGEKLPKETELAASFSVSRYVARECIQALRDRGVVRVTHGVGAFVAPRHEWNLFDPVLLRAMLDGPDAAEALAQAGDALATVWPEVVALAAGRRTDADLERLDAAEDGAAVRDALAVAARNRFLRQVVASLDRAVAPPPGGPEAYRAVLDAVRSGDADAGRAAMRELAGGWSPIQ